MCNEFDIRLGDCIDVMRNIPTASVDMILVDPPYGIDYQSQRRKDKATWKPKIIGDKTPFIDFVPEMSRIIKSSGCVLLFTRWDVQQKFIDAMTDVNMKPKAVIIWDKVAHGMGDLKRAPASRYESIIYWSGKDFSFPGKRPVDVVTVPRVPAQKLIHPNEKPVTLLEYLVNTYSRPGDLILDNCMGSGSTGVACMNAKRRFIGIEKDAKYFNIAKDRICAALNVCGEIT